MTSDFNLQIYLRYKNEKYKELFGFEEVSEYFSRKEGVSTCRKKRKLDYHEIPN
jgi:hypothetical protein